HAQALDLLRRQLLRIEAEAVHGHLAGSPAADQVENLAIARLIECNRTELRAAAAVRRGRVRQRQEQRSIPVRLLDGDDALAVRPGVRQPNDTPGPGRRGSLRVCPGAGPPGSPCPLPSLRPGAGSALWGWRLCPPTPDE